jgi:hypothetical protein
MRRATAWAVPIGSDRVALFEEPLPERSRIVLPLSQRLQVSAAAMRPGGRREAPPEDCGGIWAFNE